MDLSFSYRLVLKVHTITILQEDFNEFNYYCGEAPRESTLERAPNRIKKRPFRQRAPVHFLLIGGLKSDSYVIKTSHFFCDHINNIGRLGL